MPLFHAPFQDRRDAGRQLAGALLPWKDQRPLILALPRGGVPVAWEIAQVLDAPLDVCLVRKIGAPWHRELGLGAVAEGREPFCVLDRDLAERAGASDAYLADEQARQLEEIGRRRVLYRGNAARADPGGRVVVVVDDGAATGSTMKAALHAIRAEAPRQLLFAVPVAPPETVAELRALADDGICLQAPADFRAVSQYYDDFAQTEDAEVIALLKEARHRDSRSDRPCSAAAATPENSNRRPDGAGGRA